jgi:hypothetical protein
MRDQIDRWMRTARKGDDFVYHIGLLSADRGDPEAAPLTEKQRLIDDGATRVQQLIAQKRVTATQRKLSTGVFAYKIVRL